MPWPMPSNEDDAAGAALPTVVCTAASSAPVTARGKLCSGRSRFGCVASSGLGRIAASRGETSFFEDEMTVNPSEFFANAGPGSARMSTSAQTKTVVALNISLFPLRQNTRVLVAGENGMA